MIRITIATKMYSNHILPSRKYRRNPLITFWDILHHTHTKRPYQNVTYFAELFYHD